MLVVDVTRWWREGRFEGRCDMREVLNGKYSMAGMRSKYLLIPSIVEVGRWVPIHAFSLLPLTHALLFLLLTLPRFPYACTEHLTQGAARIKFNPQFALPNMHSPSLPAFPIFPSTPWITAFSHYRIASLPHSIITAFSYIRPQE